MTGESPLELKLLPYRLQYRLTDSNSKTWLTSVFYHDKRIGFRIDTFYIEITVSFD